jgi:tetratricopeptide (TPR) repeat protein
MFHEDRYLRQEIRRLKKRVKQNPLLFARLGDCHLRLGKADLAESVLKEGMNAFPDYSNAFRVLAEIHFLKGFYRDAEENCRKGLERDPNHLGLLHLLMRIKKKEDNDWEAGQLQKTMARLDPLHAPEYGIETEPAADDEDTASAPSAAEIWKAEAAPRDQKAAEERPDRVEKGSPAQEGQGLQKYLNEILESSEQLEAEEELESTPEPTEAAPAGIATRTLGELYAKQEKYDEAIEVYRQLLDLDPANEAYQNRLQELVQLQETSSEKRKANHDG